MHALRSVLMLVLLAAVAACSKEAPPAPAMPPPVSAAAVDGPDSLEDGLRGAAEIEAKRPALRKVEGKLAMGDTSAEFEALYEGVVLRHVREEASYGEMGRGEKEYYLDSTGVLFYHHAEDERAATQAGQPAKESVSIRIAFDPAGNVRASEKTRNGQPAPLLDTDIQGAVARLGALRQAAEAADRPEQPVR
jgi:hypothetical protein